MPVLPLKRFTPQVDGQQAFDFAASKSASAYDPFWDGMSEDVESERVASETKAANVALAKVWPFLSRAKTQREFGHRMALMATEITEAVEGASDDPRVHMASREQLHKNFETLLKSRKQHPTGLNHG